MDGETESKKEIQVIKPKNKVCKIYLIPKYILFLFTTSFLG